MATPEAQADPALPPGVSSEWWAEVSGLRQGRVERNVKTVVVAVALALAAGCRSPTPGGRIPDSPARSEPVREPVSFVPGTDVPLPPAQYGFGTRDWYPLIGAPVNDYLLIGTEQGDPSALTVQMAGLLEYYRTVMAQEGWVLVRDYPLRLETEKGDPADWYSMAQDWAKGDQQVKLSVSNYAQWYGWGYRLTFTVYGNNKVHFERNSQ
jgi:hypothetical protein